jgi:hypothetical protein
MTFCGSATTNPAAVDAQVGPLVIVAASPGQVATMENIGRSLGREVRVRDATVAALSVRWELPSAVLVGLRDGPAIALEVIEAAARPNVCPIIALLDGSEPDDYAGGTLARGAFICMANLTCEELERSLLLAAAQTNGDYLDLVAALAARVEAGQAYDVYLNRHHLPTRS